MKQSDKIKHCVNVVVKEIGYPDTKEKVEKMAKRLEKLLILSELMI